MSRPDWRRPSMIAVRSWSCRARTRLRDLRGGTSIGSSKIGPVEFAISGASGGSMPRASFPQMERSSGMRLWAPPVVGAMVYPGLIVCFQWAVRGYRESSSLLMALTALMLMLMATSVPVMAAAALFRMRQQAGPVVTRGVLYLVFAIPSLFSLTYSLSRVVGVR